MFIVGVWLWCDTREPSRFAFACARDLTLKTLNIENQLWLIDQVQLNEEIKHAVAQYVRSQESSIVWHFCYLYVFFSLLFLWLFGFLIVRASDCALEEKKKLWMSTYWHTIQLAIAIS